MKVFVPANNKGGVGKTSMSTLFAEYASKILKKKTLAIDFDSQCNFSQRFLAMEVDPIAPEGWMPPIHPDYDQHDPDCADWDGRSTIADIFFGKPVIPYPTYIENLDICPAHANKLLVAEAVRRSDIVDKIHKHTHQFLSCQEIHDTYDLIVIDTAPSKGALTVSAIKAATHMIIPTTMEEKPINGVFGMLQLWMQESLNRDPKRPLELIGILPNMFNSKTNLHNEMYHSLLENQAIGKYVLPHKLGNRIIFAETDSQNHHPRSIFDLPDSNAAKQEALAVCETLAKEVFG